MRVLLRVRVVRVLVRVVRVVVRVVRVLVRVVRVVRVLVRVVRVVRVLVRMVRVVRADLALDVEAQLGLPALERAHLPQNNMGLDYQRKNSGIAANECGQGGPN